MHALRQYDSYNKQGMHELPMYILLILGLQFAYISRILGIAYIPVYDRMDIPKVRRWCGTGTYLQNDVIFGFFPFK